MKLHPFISANLLAFACTLLLSEFGTPTTATAATAASATAVTGSTVTVYDTIPPRGEQVTVSFQYGLTTSYELGNCAPVAIPPATIPVYATGTLTGLTPSTFYHFRTVIYSYVTGATSGPDSVLATAPRTATAVEAAIKATSPGIAGTQFLAFGSPCMKFGSGSYPYSLAFNATLNGTGVTATNNDGVWYLSGTGASPVLVARTGSLAPGISPAANFSSLGDPIIDDPNSVIFRGLVSGIGGSIKGLWASNAGAAPTLLVCSGSSAPGYPGGVVFADFTAFADTQFNGVLVFTASVTGKGVTSANNSGIWYIAPNSTAPQLIVRTGDGMTVAGKPLVITSLMTLSPTTTSSGQTRHIPYTQGCAQTLAYLARFSDGGSAIEFVTLSGGVD